MGLVYEGGTGREAQEGGTGREVREGNYGEGGKGREVRKDRAYTLTLLIHYLSPFPGGAVSAAGQSLVSQRSPRTGGFLLHGIQEVGVVNHDVHTVNPNPIPLHTLQYGDQNVYVKASRFPSRWPCQQAGGAIAVTPLPLTDLRTAILKLRVCFEFAMQ